MDNCWGDALCLDLTLGVLLFLMPKLVKNRLPQLQHFSCFFFGGLYRLQKHL
ncbi:hypothetical protein [Anabaena sp. AL09]|uniref:hypothetical protein n=1 Tax=Anabaena sp. AL09 TaxID=1710891 RepID=UPI00262241CF|nr:hypothetical protein [Anabaena sp. AL09]